MKSIYPIQIDFLGTFQEKFAKYPGPPSCKNATTQFHNQNPEKTLQNIRELHPPKSDFEFSGFSQKQMLSTLGLPPANMQQRNFISKMPKQPPKHRRNPSTQFRCVVLGTFQEKFAKCPGPPSCKNATTQFHKQNPENSSNT